MNYLKELKNILKPHSEIKIAIVFGSVLDNKRFTSQSDIDIAIAGDKIFTSEYLSRLNIELSSKLKHEIDIIDLNNNSGVILRQALCKGRLILNNDSLLYAHLIKKMWYNQEDMMNNVRMVWEQRRKKLI